MRDGTASLIDVSLYARRIGEHTSSALLEVLTAEALPDGRLYWNIAERTVSPALRNAHRLTNAAAVDVQRAVDAADGIGLNAITAAFPEERAKKLLDVLTADDLTFDIVRRTLGEPVSNLCQSFADDFVQENASFRQNAGMETIITREIAGGACPWCRSMAGSYTYGKHPADIFRRHDSCRCAVTYQAGRYLQNVHTRRWYDSETRNAVRIKDLVDADVYRLTPGEAAARQQAMQQMQRQQRKRDRAGNRLTRTGQ